MKIQQQNALLGRPKILSAQDETRDQGTRSVLVHEIDLPIRVNPRGRQFYSEVARHVPGVEPLALAISEDDDRQGFSVKFKQKWGAHHVSISIQQHDLQVSTEPVSAKFSEIRGAGVFVTAKGEIFLDLTLRMRVESEDLVAIASRIGQDLTLDLEPAQVEAELFPEDAEAVGGDTETESTTTTEDRTELWNTFEGELKALNISLREFSKACGVSARSIGGWLKGERDLPEAKLSQISVTLKGLKAVAAGEADHASVS